ncbi:hypothetical protein KP509_29G047800 [Ceratopteris richardii]|uniref:PPIase cyclophilin-type domain-containing protein n=1 Tax=Ceratopteris richardii TaxID=49495 RepID=A0A8T2R6R4_CERRI|nr:hypothetical protein KP509_29G047800 [Ceratopteris richardii]
MQHRARPSPLLGSEEASIASHNVSSNLGKHAPEQDAGWRPFFILFFITFCTCAGVYFALSPFFGVPMHSSTANKHHEIHISDCCRGTPNLELWGPVARSGENHVFNSSFHCCNSCKEMCLDDGPCLCNSWVFCSDSEKCGNMFGQCWLKMQEDPLNPNVRDSSPSSMWTSGLIYGKDVGIIAFGTKHGNLRIKLLPECAPKSVAYVLEMLKDNRCSGSSYYYRAESRGTIWNELGDRSNQSSIGPPYGLVQGYLENPCSTFKGIEQEACPKVRRGAVGWIANGPDFFISLANHNEWYPKYTVFGLVLSEDLHILEKLVELPTTPSIWEGVHVSLLNQYVNIKVKKI